MESLNKPRIHIKDKKLIKDKNPHPIMYKKNNKKLGIYVLKKFPEKPTQCKLCKEDTRSFVKHIRSCITIPDEIFYKYEYLNNLNNIL